MSLPSSSPSEDNTVAGPPSFAVGILAVIFLFYFFLSPAPLVRILCCSCRICACLCACDHYQYITSAADTPTAGIACAERGAFCLWARSDIWACEVWHDPLHGGTRREAVSRARQDPHAPQVQSLVAVRARAPARTRKCLWVTPGLAVRVRCTPSGAELHERLVRTCRGVSARTRGNTLVGLGYWRQLRWKRDSRSCASQRLAMGSTNRKGTPLHQAVTEDGASQGERRTRNGYNM